MTVLIAPHGQFTASTKPPTWVQQRADVIRAQVEQSLSDDPALPFLKQLAGIDWGCGLNERQDGSWYTYFPYEGPEESAPPIDLALIDQFYDIEDVVTAYLIREKRAWRSVLRGQRARLGGAQFNAAYQAYLQSFAWKLFRNYALLMAGHQCTGCNAGGVTLQVHHHSYQNIGREEYERDVTVLCLSCHRSADSERGNEVTERGLQTWADKVYGRGWEMRQNWEEVEEAFEEWKESKR